MWVTTHSAYILLYIAWHKVCMCINVYFEVHGTSSCESSSIVHLKNASIQTVENIFNWEVTKHWENGLDMFSLNSFSPINHSTFQSSGTPSRLVQLVEWCLGSHHHSCTNWASNGSYDGIFWCWNSAIIIPYISLVSVKMQLVYGVMPLRVLCSMITTLIVCTLPKGCTWAYNVGLKHRQIWKTIHHTAFAFYCVSLTLWYSWLPSK